MIHLDTNYLIGLLVKGSPQAIEVDGCWPPKSFWPPARLFGQSFSTARPTEISRASAVLQSRIIPFGQSEAVLAAELFNKTGRRRGSRFDCLIAATAMVAQAEVATVNQSDFKVFVPHGLKLAIAPAPPASPPSPADSPQKSD